MSCSGESAVAEIIGTAIAPIIPERIYKLCSSFAKYKLVMSHTSIHKSILTTDHVEQQDQREPFRRWREEERERVAWKERNALISSNQTNTHVNGMAVHANIAVITSTSIIDVARPTSSSIYFHLNNYFLISRNIQYMKSLACRLMRNWYMFFSYIDTEGEEQSHEAREWEKEGDCIP